MEKEEEMLLQEKEKQEEAQLLRELQAHQGWTIYLALLEKLCRIKEVEKSRALRDNNAFIASARQFEIDGILQARKVIDNQLNQSAD